LSALERSTFDTIRNTYTYLVTDVLGLKEEKSGGMEEMLELVLGFYKEAKENKAYDKVDAIRAELKKQGIVIKDLKTGIDWAYEE